MREYAPGNVLERMREYSSLLERTRAYVRVLRRSRLSRPQWNRRMSRASALLAPFCAIWRGRLNNIQVDCVQWNAHNGNAA